MGLFDNKQKKINETLNNNNNELARQNLELGQQNQNLQAMMKENQTYNDLVAKAPAFALNINDQFLADNNLLNTNWTIGITQSFGTSGGNANMFCYLLILERARYFKNHVVFNDDFNNRQLLKMLYEMLYYGALAGQVALILDEKEMKFKLGQVEEAKYNAFNELEFIRVRDINIFSSEESAESYEPNSNNVVVYHFNNSNFGLWVLSGEYIKQIAYFFETVKVQTEFLNKKFFVKLDNEALSADQSQFVQITGQKPYITVNKDIQIDKLEVPDVDITQLYTCIENGQNYMDFHILGIDTKDIQTSKDRDVASQQLNHQNNIKNKSQGVDYGLDDLIDQIKDKGGIMISYENNSIDLNDEIQDKSMSMNKINEGNNTDE